MRELINEKLNLQDENPFKEPTPLDPVPEPIPDPNPNPEPPPTEPEPFPAPPEPIPELPPDVVY